jgi:hypothetical protein
MAENRKYSHQFWSHQELHGGVQMRRREFITLPGGGWRHGTCVGRNSPTAEELSSAGNITGVSNPDVSAVGDRRTFEGSHSKFARALAIFEPDYPTVPSLRCTRSCG